MSKRQVNINVVAILEAFTCDMCSRFPEVTEELVLSCARLSESFVERGVSVFYIDLPVLGKHLDRCVDLGAFDKSPILHKPFTASAGKCNVLPQLWNELWRMIFDTETGEILLNEKGLANVDAIRCLRQGLYLYKKVEIDCPEDAKRESVEAFIETEEALPEPSLVWDKPEYTMVDFTDAWSFSRLQSDGPSHFSGINKDFACMLDAVSARLTCVLGGFDPKEHLFKHGPGAISVPVRGGKYAFENWNERLDSVFPISEFGYANHGIWANAMSDPSSFREVTSIEVPSRMVMVRKTYKAPRLIACEPVEHQWCQQSCWSYLRSRSEASWVGRFILFKDQTQNQQLAIRGSKDESLATIDLSEASDRVTPAVVEAVFRSNPPFLRALAASRTRSVQLPDGRIHKLKKFSTMGSACTFPVESLVFLVVAIAVDLSKRMGPSQVTTEKIKQCIGRISVFGDDIIVPNANFDQTISALETLCFKVNHGKSFSGKRFRESCGSDAVHGEVVTPVYWKRMTVTTAEEVVSMAMTKKHLLEAGYLNLARLAGETIQGKLSPVPMSSASTGIPYSDIHMIQAKDGSYHNALLSDYKYRWNKQLQKIEVRVRSIVARQIKRRNPWDAALLQYFTENPSPLTKWEHGFTQRTVTGIQWSWVDPYSFFGPDYGFEAELIGLTRMESIVAPLLGMNFASRSSRS